MPFLIHTYNDSDAEIPTIQLGIGDIFMGVVSHDDSNSVGMGFIVQEPGEIGRERSEHKDKTVTELPVVFQILSEKRESLEVLKEIVEQSLELFDKTFPSDVPILTQNPNTTIYKAEQDVIALVSELISNADTSEPFDVIVQALDYELLANSYVNLQQAIETSHYLKGTK